MKSRGAQNSRFLTRFFAVVVLCTFALLPSVVIRAASPPNLISYQGRLLDANSAPVSSASVSAVFELFTDSSATTCVWSNSSSTCATSAERTMILTDGLFSEDLGDTTIAAPYAAITDDIFADNATLHLRVTINGEALAPLRQITAAPYALNSETLDGFSTSQVGGASAFVPVTDGSGNLTLTGDITSNDITVNGTVITFDADNVGAGANARLIANQGSDNDGELRYNASTNQWEISNDGGGFVAIAVGSGSGTLQDSYDNGNSLTTTDARDITFTLGDTTTDSDFAIGIATGSTSTVSISRAAGAGVTNPSQLLKLEDLDGDLTIADGLLIETAGVLTDAIDLSDAEIVNALNIGANIITGTTPTINSTGLLSLNTTNNAAISTGSGLFTAGGALTVTGTLTANGNVAIGNDATDQLTITSEILGGTPMSFEGSTDNNIYTIFAITDPTVSSKTITFPNATGEVSLLGQSIDLTSEITGTLTVANGGTGATTLTLNGILYGNGTSAVQITAAGTPGQLLVASAADIPTFVTLSSDITLSSTGAATIQADAVALSTDTTGNYVASLTNGSGIAGGDGGSEGAALTLALGALTADWSQTGAFDIILNNADSQLQILESVGGAFYGTLDVGDLTANRTYTLPDQTGTLALTSDLTGSSITLDTAYDGGGSGSGRTITADSGAVTINNTTVGGAQAFSIDHTASGTLSANSTTLTSIASNRTQTFAGIVSDNYDLASIVKTSEVNSGTTYTVNGAVLRLENALTQTSGSFTGSSDVLEITQDVLAGGYAINVTAGDTFLADDLFIGSGTELIDNGAYSLSGDDAYILGFLGVEAGIFTDGGFFTDDATLVGDTLFASAHAVTTGAAAGSTDLNTFTSARTHDAATSVNDTFDLVSIAGDYTVNNGGATYNVDGSILRLSNTMTASSGVFTGSTIDVLNITQDSDSSGYAINVTAGDVYFADDLFVGATAETLANAGFVLDGDDAFIAGMFGVEGNIYTDTGFIVGATTTITDGDIESSGALTINDTNNQAITTGTGLFSTGGDLDVADQLAIGNAGAITTNVAAQISHNYSTAASSFGIDTVVQQASTGDLYGMRGTANTNISSGTVSNVAGLLGRAGTGSSSGGTITNLYGVFGQITTNASVSGTTGSGFFSSVDFTNGSAVTELYGYRSAFADDDGVTNTSDYYGFATAFQPDPGNAGAYTYGTYRGQHIEVGNASVTTGGSTYTIANVLGIDLDLTPATDVTYTDATGIDLNLSAAAGGVITGGGGSDIVGYLATVNGDNTGVADIESVYAARLTATGGDTTTHTIGASGTAVGGTGTYAYGVYGTASGGGTGNYSGYFHTAILQVDDDATPDVSTLALGAGSLFVVGDAEFDGFLALDGDQDTVQLTVTGFSTQTADIFQVEKSAGSSILDVANINQVATTTASSVLSINDTISNNPTTTRAGLEIDLDLTTTAFGTISSANDVLMAGIDVTVNPDETGSIQNGGAGDGIVTGIHALTQQGGGTTTADAYYGVWSELDLDGFSEATGTKYAFLAEIKQDEAGIHTSASGIVSELSQSGAPGTITDYYGIQSSVEPAASGVITNPRGLGINVDYTGGEFGGVGAAAYGIEIDMETNHGAAQDPENTYGIDIVALGGSAGATPTSIYGVRASASGADSNYSGYFYDAPFQIDANGTPDAPTIATAAGELFVSGDIETDGDLLVDGGQLKINATGTSNDAFIDINSSAATTSFSELALQSSAETWFTYVASTGHTVTTDYGFGSDEDLRWAITNPATGVPATDVMRLTNGGNLITDGTMTPSSTADVGEAYLVTDLGSEAGDVLGIQPNGDIVRVANGDGNQVLGVISTNPGLLLGTDETGELNPGQRVIALVGRVPTKVNLENGAITTGDAISVSSITGEAMKAIGPGMVLGYALEDYDGSAVSNKIEVFVHLGWNAVDKITLDGTAVAVNSDLIVNSIGDATAGNPLVDSESLVLRGSIYDAGSPVDTDFSLSNVVTNATDYRLSIKNAMDTEVAYIDQDGAFSVVGDVVVGDHLYPSDRGVAQTNRYIFYDGSAGPGGDFMRTNASGWATGSYDFAEMFPSRDVLEPGDVVVIAEENEYVKRSTKANSRMIAGVVSTRPGFLAGENKAGQYPIALAGRVPTKVNNEGGAIAIGDALTTSSTAGVAMKATGPTMILGYALEAMNGTSGEVIAFINATYWNGADTQPSNTASGYLGGASLGSLDLSGDLYIGSNNIVNVGSISGMAMRWEIEENGDFRTEGIYSTTIETYGGEKVETFASTSSEVYITLAGTLELKEGVAHVSYLKEDPNFMGIVSAQVPVRITATPYAPISVFITNKTSAGFDIRQINGSASGVVVDWNAVGYRKDLEPERYLIIEDDTEEIIEEDVILDEEVVVETEVIEEEVVDETSDPVPTPDPVVVPEPVVTPDPIVEPTPDPVVELEPVVEVVPAPEPEVAPEPIVEEPVVIEPVVEPLPVVEVIPEPTPDPVVEVVPAPEPEVAPLPEQVPVESEVISVPEIAPESTN